MDNTEKIYFKDFWTFAIISTLMIIFFPWSLLVSVIFFGLDTTKLVIKAILNDLLRTLFAVISVLLAVAVPIIILIILFNG